MLINGCLPFVQDLKQTVFIPISMNKTSTVEVIAQQEGVFVYMSKKGRVKKGSFSIRKELIVWEHRLPSYENAK